MLINGVLPEAAIGQHIAIIGKTGSGKTFAAKGLIEWLLKEKRRVGIIDPTGAWYGLRSSRDGKGPGFPVLVLGGDHGDLPLPALGGAAVARLLVEQGVNLVADTSHLTIGERTRWFIDFAGTLHRANKSPLHLVLDEAHNFAPQGKVIDPDAGKMLHAANRLAAEGRSRGIRLTMITQRPQKLHKDALTSADTLIAMRVLAPQDRLAVEDWIKGCGDMAAGKEVLNSLASLQRGEGWVWYPEGAHLQRVKFPQIRTFDSSATPTDGHAVVMPKGAAEIDLGEIKTALADAVKEAAANDPKVLRAKIAELERQARAKPQPTDTTSRLDLNAEYARGRADGFDAGILRAVQIVKPQASVASTALAQITEALAKQQAGAGADPLQLAADRPREVATAERRSGAQLQVSHNPAGGPASGNGSLPRPQQRILDSLADLEVMGIRQPSKTQLALWVDVSPTSGGYFNNLGQLRAAGLIDYPGNGSAALTDAGRDAAVLGKRRSVDEMQADVFRKVGTSRAAILRVLIEIYPEAIAKDELADRVNVSRTSGGYFNNCGSLRTLGLIDYPAPGMAAATPVLFLK